jgi:hypothetical protein
MKSLIMAILSEIIFSYYLDHSFSTFLTTSFSTIFVFSGDFSSFYSFASTLTLGVIGGSFFTPSYGPAGLGFPGAVGFTMAFLLVAVVAVEGRLRGELRRGVSKGLAFAGRRGVGFWGDTEGLASLFSLFGVAGGSLLEAVLGRREGVHTYTSGFGSTFFSSSTYVTSRSILGIVSSS